MASNDITPLLDSQPPNLPFNVSRVTADGRPTQYLLDWENFTSDWFRSNIVKTDQRIDTVKAVADGASAAVTTETNARVAADAALAEQITTVSASVGKATASGQIYFGAMAGPAGSVAAYGVFLTAGDTYAGMQIIAESGGGASIGFAANDFRLTDSGTAQNVFNYTAGVFTFNVPVRVGTLDIATQAVTAPSVVSSGSVTALNSTAGGWFTLISASATGISGYAAIISADCQYRLASGTGTITGRYRLLKNGSTVLRSGNLFLFADFSPIFINKLDADMAGSNTYELQVTIATTGTVTFEFTDKSIMIDMRKR
ncbi:hypothetical protein [Microvirga alba]|uniref:DUF1983 domain-containing protein n=1 Tax=Microvirga alba TaxID=2791025 RepID=A0A931BPP0_9HYPH|nr:hypothetical protein [Microvirga alba]MBF9234686.1 hypothetical protein [Microvirga alba]